MDMAEGWFWIALVGVVVWLVWWIGDPRNRNRR